MRKVNLKQILAVGTVRNDADGKPDRIYFNDIYRFFDLFDATIERKTGRIRGGFFIDYVTRDGEILISNSRAYKFIDILKREYYDCKIKKFTFNIDDIAYDFGYEIVREDAPAEVVNCAENENNVSFNLEDDELKLFEALGGVQWVRKTLNAMKVAAL